MTVRRARVLAARRLVAKRPPRRAAPPATVASVGKERRRLAARRRAELRFRIRHYRATCEVLRRHAQRPPGAKQTRGEPPLRILAEGDSWFDWPLALGRGGIVPRLEDRLGVPILNLAQAGDETRFMLGVEQRQVLEHQLERGAARGAPWDVLLFSGGGNDVVGQPMPLWIKPWNARLPPERHLDVRRFRTVLATVRAAYDDLVALRDAVSPATRIVLHAYDYPIPDGRGACFFGPWLEPTLAYRGFPGVEEGAAVVERMLREFAAMLDAVAASSPRVTVVPTQGTLHDRREWHDELHPTGRGFDALVEVFHRELVRLYPGRLRGR